MSTPFDWLKRIFRAEPSGMLTLLTPEAARGQNPVVRIALAGGTAFALAGALAVAASAFAALMFAIAVIYFLSTRILGLKVNIDPRAFYDQVQRQAQSYGPN